MIHLDPRHVLIVESQDATAEPLRLRIMPGELGTAQTIAAMHAVIDDAQRSPLIAALAQDVRETAREAYGGADRMIDFAEGRVPAWACALWQWVQAHIEFRSDGRAELLRHPHRLMEQIVRHRRALADCDDQTVFHASLFRRMGWPYRIVTVGPRDGDWRHVYAALDDEGRVIAFDPQDTDRPGQHPPAPFRRVWAQETHR